MKREQAKIIGQLSDEQLEVVSQLVGTDYPTWIKVIRHLGEGGKVEFLGCDNKWREDKNPIFTGKHTYRIATPKITFNGVEIDAPIRDYDSAPTEIWALVETAQGLKMQKFLKDPVHTQILIASGLAWADREACQLYRDTHNKMMGVGDS